MLSREYSITLVRNASSIWSHCHSCPKTNICLLHSITITTSAVLTTKCEKDNVKKYALHSLNTTQEHNNQIWTGYLISLTSKLACSVMTHYILYIIRRKDTCDLDSHVKVLFVKKMRIYYTDKQSCVYFTQTFSVITLMHTYTQAASVPLSFKTSVMASYCELY